MARYQITLAYDGTDFSGFQRQAKEKNSRTVQDEFETALRRIGWKARSILAAGRTDAGVHALGQVVAFDLEWNHSDSDLLAALNANLPKDIAVRSACQTHADFHPRFDARARRYQYSIFCSPLRNPLRERYAWRIWPELDFGRLEQAASILIGTHDFGAFGSPPQPAGATIRKIFAASWRMVADNFEPPQLLFEILGNAFLYRMVRRLVNFQVSISQGKIEVEALRQCLESGTKQLVKGLAPSHGLCLTEVLYSDLLENFK
jgi:tRNA pseudouridine38-40 synthase